MRSLRRDDEKTGFRGPAGQPAHRRRRRGREHYCLAGHGAVPTFAPPLGLHILFWGLTGISPRGLDPLRADGEGC
jgi:hypothetical protein